MRSRIPAIAKKEFLHIVRDWRTLGMSIVLPLIMILLFGYAITFDIKQITLAVYDADHSEQSRELVSRFTSSGYFKLVASAKSDSELGYYLDNNLAKIAISIPEDYSESLGKPAQSAFSESNTAGIAASYIQTILVDLSLEYSLDYFSAVGISTPPKLPLVDLRQRFWYNPEMRSQNYIIPGLIATIMMVMTALLTSLCIVGEKERGSMEQLISTPVRSYEIIVGKLIPYFCIGFFDSAMIAAVGVFLMGVPFVGSILMFVAVTSIFALAGLGIGIRISTVSHNQVMAMQVAILASMLPSFLLSGFMFAIKNMPEWVQLITYLIPARYFLVALRGIFLKDQGIDLLWPQFAVLGVLAVVFLGITIKSFKKKIG